MNIGIYVSSYPTIMYMPVCKSQHEWNVQTYGEAACPVYPLGKIYNGALIFTEHKIKAS